MERSMSITVISGGRGTASAGPRPRSAAHMQDPAPGPGGPRRGGEDQPVRRRNGKICRVGMTRKSQFEFSPRGRVQLRAVLEEEQ